MARQTKQEPSMSNRTCLGVSGVVGVRGGIFPKFVGIDGRRDVDFSGDALRMHQTTLRCSNRLLLNNAEDNLAILDHHAVVENRIRRFGIGGAIYI